MRFVCLLLVACMANGLTRADAKDFAIPRPPFAGKFASNEPSAAKKKQSPGMLARLSAAPKRLLTATKDLLTPKKKPAAKKAPVKNVGRNSKNESQAGFFKQLFDREPPPPPRTVEEWMALEQIHP